jgi:hypothetical protein
MTTMAVSPVYSVRESVVFAWLWNIPSPLFSFGTTTVSNQTTAHMPVPAAPIDSTSPLPPLTVNGTAAAEGDMAPARKIAEARLTSGLTWDELARIMSVSRRSLHLWANGHAINAENEQRLSRLLAALRAIDRGAASANRRAILGPDQVSQIPLDLLIRGRFDEFTDALGLGGGRPRPSRTPPMPDSDRMPPPPAMLLNALDEPVRAELPRLAQRQSRRWSRRLGQGTV